MGVGGWGVAWLVGVGGQCPLCSTWLPSPPLPQASFATLTFRIRGSVFAWGHFVNVLLTFVMVCTIIYFLIVLPINTFAAMIHSKDTAKTRKC